MLGPGPPARLLTATRSRLYEIDDGFLRFWFRFVFPFQADLEAGLSPAAVLASEVMPHLADHVAPTIEGIARGRVVVVGEVRWRNEPMDVGILGEIERFKLPALRRATQVANRPMIMLVSRWGFSQGLREAATHAGHIRLVELGELVAR